MRKRQHLQRRNEDELAEIAIKSSTYPSVAQKGPICALFPSTMIRLLIMYLTLLS